MKLKKLMCPNCNAPIEVDKDVERFKCKFCGAQIVVDDEIIKVNHTILSGEKEEKFKNANAFLKLKEYDKAFDCFEQLSEEYVYEARAWYSLVLCLTHEFTFFELDTFNMPFVDLEQCEDYMDRYLKLETNDKLKEERNKEFEAYKKKLLDIIDIKNRVAQKANEIESKFIKKGIIICIAVVATFIVLNYFYERRENEKEPEIEVPISVESFFNNSSEDLSVSKKEFKTTENLCYHFKISSKQYSKYNDVKVEISIEGEKLPDQEFEYPIQNGEFAWVCYENSEEDPGDVGEYEFTLYDGYETKLDTKKVTVVE